MPHISPTIHQVGMIAAPKYFAESRPSNACGILDVTTHILEIGMAINAASVIERRGKACEPGSEHDAAARQKQRFTAMDATEIG